jgi:hypothetical protein
MKISISNNKSSLLSYEDIEIVVNNEVVGKLSKKTRSFDLEVEHLENLKVNSKIGGSKAIIFDKKEKAEMNYEVETTILGKFFNFFSLLGLLSFLLRQLIFWDSEYILEVTIIISAIIVVVGLTFGMRSHLKLSEKK